MVKPTKQKLHKKPTKQKLRKKFTRSPKKVILIGAEGNNKTETNYFSNFKSVQDKYKIYFSTGNKTDALQIIDDMEKWMNRNDFDSEEDRAFLVIDSDNKSIEIKKAIDKAESKNIQVILSVPCFEVWFLLHFHYSTAFIDSSQDAVEKLKEYIPNYQKSQNVYDILDDKREEAFKNAESLRIFHRKSGHKKMYEQNPSTNVDRLVIMLLK
jgi:hypothetical protein